MSGGRNTKERILATATVAAATDLVTEETITTGRGTGQSPRPGGETERGQPRGEGGETERGQLRGDGGGTERGQAPPPGRGGRGQAHTGETDLCPPETEGRDTDNIMLENKLCKYKSSVTITCVTCII